MTLSRHRVSELMDDPELDADRHRDALRGLARVNAVSGIDAVIWKIVAPLARKCGRALRLLDVATGAGDLPIRLARRAAREGLTLDLHACDASRVALAYAHAAAGRAQVRLVLHRVDVLTEPLPLGFDVAYSGLFLHHLEAPQAERVLRQMAGSAPTVVVQDLRRSTLGLAMAWAVPRLVTASSVVHVDAVRSVRAAFTIEEMSEAARRAGLVGGYVRPIWPERQLLLWHQPA